MTLLAFAATAVVALPHPQPPGNERVSRRRSSQTDDMATPGDSDTLRRFVMRARRVQAHSLVQDWDGLLRHASGGFEGQLDVSGRMTLTRRLPEDEEVFESLASRIRPLTVKSEPVYYVKVFDAIERNLSGARIQEERKIRLRDLRRAWDAAEIQGTQVQAYAVQSVRLDGTEATNMVSDTQLAAAWLYADLVHADAQGPKREALAFPLRERYAAAVRVFSRMAALTAETLQLIESLRDDGVLAVEDSAWEDDAVVGASELSEEARAYLAPLGSEIPDMRRSLQLTEEWTAFTVTDLLRQDPANQVRVVLRDEGAEVVASYDAAVVRRDPEGTSAAWDVLVAGSVVFKFSFALQGEQVAHAEFRGWEAFDSTNELRLASTRLLLQLHRAVAMAFEVRGNDLLSLVPPTFSARTQRELEVIAQTIDDIVTIERISGQPLAPCNGPFDDRDRVRLRRARLMSEGLVVHAMRHPVTVTAPQGVPPQVIVVASGSLNVGGVEVPTPRTLMRHPRMIVTEADADRHAGADARRFRIEPPGEEQFLAWAPERLQVPDDDVLVVGAPWDLTGIDEETFRY